MSSSKTVSDQGDDLSTFLSKLIQSVPGLYAAVISDREGVTIVKAASGPDRDDELALTVTFASATEHAGKLKLGRNRTITSFHDNRIVVQVNHVPLLMTFVGDVECNVGLLQSLLPDIKKALEPLRAVIADSDRELQL
eukprot:TRINITY_DN3783_c0_g1_i1.p1 TRINITY_DN3783_c0_g1~~TRINITY_DN3783_c0_g1_i1.p1  ORF type:complete len:138 (+),score=44.14 TRINITY_DN3783_c0_g1_i1:133-546(+)